MKVHVLLSTFIALICPIRFVKSYLHIEGACSSVHVHYLDMYDTPLLRHLSGWALILAKVTRSSLQLSYTICEVISAQ